MARGRRPTKNTDKNGTPKGWKLTDGASFRFNKQPVYLRDVTFGREPGKDNKQVKVCVVHCMIQPFTKTVATVLGVAGELYTGDQRNLHIQSAVLGLGVGRLPFGIEFYAAPDMEEPSIEVQDAHIGPEIRVRTDKEGPIFCGHLDLKFSYPEADDLLRLVHSIGDQWFVSFFPLQEELADVTDAPAVPPAEPTLAEAEG